MKTIIAFVALLALSNAFMRHPDSWLVPQVEDADLSDIADLPRAEINGTLQNLNTFFNALWGYYGLVQHSVIECFNPLTAQDYFQFNEARIKLANATTNADVQKFVQYLALVQVYNATLSPVYDCVEDTQDYVDLLIQIGYNVFNKSLQATLDRLYFDAHINDWVLLMIPVYNNWLAQNFTLGGLEYAKVLQLQYLNESSHTLMFMFAKGTMNGLFFFYNLSLPYQWPACYNDTTGQNDVAFLWYWARTVNQSTLQNVINNTQFYFETVGRQLIGLNIPGWICENKTNDETRIDAAVGLGLHTPTFINATYQYWQNPANSLDYIITFSEIFNGFDTVNSFGAGAILGKWYQQVYISVQSQQSEETVTA